MSRDDVFNFFTQLYQSLNSQFRLFRRPQFSTSDVDSYFDFMESFLDEIEINGI